MHDDPTGGEVTDGGCVVLTRRGSTLCPDLLESCVRRGWQPGVSDDPYLALSELCLAMRRLGDGRGLELVLDGVTDPSTDQLVLAARRFVPGVSIWRHEDGAMHLLHGPAATAPAVPSSSPAAAPVAAARPAATPDPASPPPPPPAEVPREPSDPMRVTADEIALLLNEPRGAGS